MANVNIYTDNQLGQLCTCGKAAYMDKFYSQCINCKDKERIFDQLVFGTAEVVCELQTAMADLTARVTANELAITANADAISALDVRVTALEP